MTTDVELLALRERSIGGSLSLSDATRGEHLLRRRTVVQPVAATGATSDQTAYALFQVPTHVADGVNLVSVKYIPGAAVLQHADNHKTLTLTKKTAAGGAVSTTGTVGVLTTDTGATGASGDMTANVAYSLLLSATASDRVVAAGNSLCLAITHGGTGVALPIGTLVVVYDEL